MRTTCLANSNLVALVPGGFHSERQHTSAAGRYVLWTFQGSAPDTMGEHGVRILSHPLYLVRVVDKVGGYLSLQPAADLLDATLQLTGPVLVVLNGHNYTVQSCIRERAYSIVEHYVDLEWRHLGGYYRFEVSPF